MLSRLIAGFALLCLVSCLDETEPNGWKRVAPGPDEQWDKDCSGEHYFNGCDDCNPCTFDDWCDPDTWDVHVPPWCADVPRTGEATCVHSDRNTPDGQINDCFPIATVTDVRPGKCCAGTCIDNADECVLPDVDAGLPY